MNRRFSVIASSLDADPRAAAPLARRSGFGACVLDAYASSLDLTTLSQTGRRELSRVFASQDVPLHAVQLSLGNRGLARPEQADPLLAKVVEAIEAAAQLRVPRLLVDLGPLPAASRPQAPKPPVQRDLAGLILLPSTEETARFSRDEPPPAKPADPAFVARVEAFLGEVARAADRFGVFVAFSSALAATTSLASAVTSVRCTWFGYDVDPVASLRDDTSLESLFDTLSGAIVHARARDAVAGEDRRISPAVVGRGDVAWREYLHLLDAAGHADPLCLDPAGLPSPAEAAFAGLKQLTAIATS
jgi:sugar phosphate isomerase/epimerase